MPRNSSKSGFSVTAGENKPFPGIRWFVRAPNGRTYSSAGAFYGETASEDAVRAGWKAVEKGTYDSGARVNPKKKKKNPGLRSHTTKSAAADSPGSHISVYTIVLGSKVLGKVKAVAFDDADHAAARLGWLKDTAWDRKAAVVGHSTVTGVYVDSLGYVRRSRLTKAEEDAARAVAARGTKSNPKKATSKRPQYEITFKSYRAGTPDRVVKGDIDTVARAARQQVSGDVRQTALVPANAGGFPIVAVRIHYNEGGWSGPAKVREFPVRYLG